MAVVNVEVTITTNNLSQRYSKSWNSQNIETIILLGLRLINKNPSYFAFNGLKLSLVISYPSESRKSFRRLGNGKNQGIWRLYEPWDVFWVCFWLIFFLFSRNFFLSFLDRCAVAANFSSKLEWWYGKPFVVFYILIVFKFISEILIRFHSSFSFLPFQSFQASVRVDMFHFSWSDDVRGEVSRAIVFQFPLTNLNYAYLLSMDTSPCL